MSGTTKYGNVALGVESALPAVTLPPRCRPRSRVRRFYSVLIAALRRWA